MSGNPLFAISVYALAYLTCKKGAPVTSAEIDSSIDTNSVVNRRLLSALVKARLVTGQKGIGGNFDLG